MVILLILCIIGNYVCCYFAAKTDQNETDLKKRKDKTNLLFVTSVVLSIIATVLLIRLIDSNSKGGAVGRYTYYINGKKVSSATYAASQNFAIGFLFFGFFFGTGMGLAGHIMKKKNKPKVEGKNKKPNVTAFVFSIISAVFGLMLGFSALSVFTHRLKSSVLTGAIIASILCVVLISLGCWGIITFIKRKKEGKNEKDKKEI